MTTPVQQPCHLLEQSYALLERVIASVCWRRGVLEQDAEDVRQEVLLKLATNDCAALASFRGESSLETFITVVTTRVCIDEIRQRKGRWRPSRIAQELGDATVRLEELVYRDGLEYEQAVSKLIAEGVVPSRDELDTIWPKIPQRPGRVFVDPEDVPEHPSDDDPEREVQRREQEAYEDRLNQALRATLGELSPEDQIIIRRRFWAARTVAQIARELRLEQRPLYRRLKKLQRLLRKELRARGFDPEDDDGVDKENPDA